MHEGRVLYSDHDHVHVLRYVGDIRHPVAPSVSRFVDTLLQHFEGEKLVVDLSETEAIDSTNLGEIARIAVLLAERWSKRASIVSPRSEISQVLYSMAFDEVFDICTDPPVGGGGEPIPSVAASKRESSQVILDAHRRLAQMSEGNRRQFSEVVEMMERDIGSGEPSF
jgi:anti-anti-sigma factor